MTPQSWLSLQDDEIKMDFWKRLSHFLNNGELEHVMNEIAAGRDLLHCHEELGVFTKYQLEILKLIQTLSQKYPDSVINPFL